MKPSRKENIIGFIKEAIGFIFKAVAFLGMFLFITMTGVLLLPQIVDKHPEAARTYAFSLLITTVYLFYKFMGLQVSAGCKK